MSGFSKKMVVSVLLLVFAATATYSQTMFGIKGGASFSSFWDDGVEDFEDALEGTVTDLEANMLPFFTGGIFARYEIIPDFIAIQPELLYLRSGKYWEVNDVDFKVYSDYLSLPILAKLLIPLDLPVTPSVYAGPVFNFRLRSRAENIEDIPPGADLGFLTGLSEDIGDEVRPVDVGLATGINFDIEAGPGTIVLDFRANFGFVQPFDVPDGDDIRNISYMIMAGYGLEF
ncbi:hypothetical protein CHISP_1888 [Chitinispirillum alkaliphilum]|nr:hypothetical protein CHISP_1888 [Chitinispirillum alkaliphilum]